MKKLLVLLALVVLCATPSYALLHVGVSGGYAYANMDQLNNAMEEAKKDAEAQGGTASVQKFGNSIFVNGDIGIGIIPFLHIGPRVGMQYVFPVESTTDIAGILKETTKISSMLVPLELGVTLNLGIPLSPISITAGGYAGYGLAYGLQETTTTDILNVLPEVSYKIPYNGGGFMADVAAAIEFNIAPFINLSINAGYRYALIENLNVTSKVEVPGYFTIDAGEELASAGGKMKVNFSGILAGAGLNIRF